MQTADPSKIKPVLLQKTLILINNFVVTTSGNYYFYLKYYLLFFIVIYLYLLMIFFINIFIHKVFLNQFSESCENKISRVSTKVTELEILLSVLEAKLNSIPDTPNFIPASSLPDTPSTTSVPIDSTTNNSSTPTPISETLNKGNCFSFIYLILFHMFLILFYLIFFYKKKILQQQD